MLELTWTGANRDNITMTAEAHRLLAGVDARLTSEAKAAWRWRLLLLRAESDALVAANNGRMCGPVNQSIYCFCTEGLLESESTGGIRPHRCLCSRYGGLCCSRLRLTRALLMTSLSFHRPVLCKVFQEIAAIQHTENSSECGIPHVPCTCSPHPHPQPPSPSPTACPDAPFPPQHFVPWVRAVNYSNVYGVVAGKRNVGIPLLGHFKTERGCQDACVALPNCTQYEWAGDNSAEPQWAGGCYGRCDTLWKLVPVPCGAGACSVSARRVVPTAAPA